VLRVLHRPLNLVLVGLTAAGLLTGADFGFSAIIRAGLPNAGDWELGIGPSGNNSAVTAHLSPFHPDNLERRFEIGYTAATRTAYLRYFHTNTSATTISYTTTYAYSPSAMLRWEIPSNGLYLQAHNRNRPTGVFLNNLELSGAGLTVLQPLAVTSMSAAQSGSGVNTPLGSPLIFRAAGSSDWRLSGAIRFQGLNPYTSGGARRSELHMGFSGGAFVESPEPVPAILIGSGLILFATARTRYGRKRLP
jgi:hypothetical protein